MYVCACMGLLCMTYHLTSSSILNSIYLTLISLHYSILKITWTILCCITFMWYVIFFHLNIPEVIIKNTATTIFTLNSYLTMWNRYIVYTTYWAPSPTLSIQIYHSPRDFIFPLDLFMLKYHSLESPLIASFFFCILLRTMWYIILMKQIGTYHKS